MDVFGLEIPNKPLTNYELIYYAEKLKIPNFRGVFMRDTLPKASKRRECNILAAIQKPIKSLLTPILKYFLWRQIRNFQP